MLENKWETLDKNKDRLSVSVIFHKNYGAHEMVTAISNGQMTDRPRGPKTSDRPSPKSNKSNKFFIGLLL